MSDVQSADSAGGHRFARLFGTATGKALRPLFRLVEPLVRRGYTTYAIVIVSLIVCAVTTAAGYGLAALAPTLPAPLTPPTLLLGAVLAIAGKLGFGALAITLPFWAVGGALHKDRTDRTTA
ncbi:hypothetical protein [Streptomyces fildesensis]|uniref:hypothetical protein n=1 Tax=Streptomyces fildesensis TaxID=375757 RepID=UPI0018E044C6|nr:hypothetical protein [Streptomyces fildesensis]